MDLIDQIVVGPRATYDATQVLTQMSSESESETEHAEEAEVDGDADKENINLRDRINLIKQRLGKEEEAPIAKSVLLPQLDIDLSDIEESTQVVYQSTQRITQDATQIVAATTDTQVVAEAPELTIEEKTKLLYEQKKHEREVAKQQLEQDITNVTLTDEEQDEIIAPAPLDKESEKFLNQQKRLDFFDNVNRTTKSRKEKKYSKVSFIQNFEDEEEQSAQPVQPEESEKEEESDKEIRISSPITSPMKSPSKPNNPIESYKQTLKGQEIDLDDDLEVPLLSKDKQLAIRQRFVKRLPKRLKKSKNRLLKQLFELNINQINQIVPNDEEIEQDQDEEIMVNLLEREIERARKIRKMEKMREKAAEALLGGDADYQEGDNEANDDVSDTWEHSDQEIDEENEDDVELQEDQDIHDGEEEEDEGEEGEEGEDISSNANAFIENEASDSEQSEPEIVISHTQKHTRTNILSDDEEALASQSIDDAANPENQAAADDTVIDQHLSQVSQYESAQIQIKQTINAESTQLTDQTQVITKLQTEYNLVEETTEIDNFTQGTPHATMDDEITPAAVNKGREYIKANISNVEEDEAEDEEEDDQEMQERIKAYEAKIRRKELKLLQRRKEMESKGYKKIIEGEAEESEDEWAGIGGADGELEELANSEDERMIDNNFNIDLNDDEIRKKFMEEHQIKDRKQLDKLLDDIKNHRLIKRAGANIDLSDEEDELLLNYRRQKLQEQRLKLQQVDQTNKSEKAKAFFESIKEDLVNNIISIDGSEEEEETQETDNFEEMVPKKIGEEFVRSKLSFLSESFNRYDYEQKKSNYQYDLASDGEEDLNALKMKSFTNLKRSIREVEIETDDDEANEDEDEDDLLPMRKPSMMKSFRSTSSASSTFSGVTVSKQYKTAGGSKASITFMSKKKIVQKRKIKH